MTSDVSESIIVSLRRDGGPVSVRVTPGSALQGKGLVTRLNRMNLKSSLVTRLELDGVPLELPLGIDPGELPDYQVTIHGSYTPAPGHSRIAVTYSFVQDRVLLTMSRPAEIAEAGDATGPSDFHHRFEFRPETEECPTT